MKTVAAMNPSTCSVNSGVWHRAWSSVGYRRLDSRAHEAAMVYQQIAYHEVPVHGCHLTGLPTSYYITCAPHERHSSGGPHGHNGSQRSTGAGEEVAMVDQVGMLLSRPRLTWRRCHWLDWSIAMVSEPNQDRSEIFLC